MNDVEFARELARLESRDYTQQGIPMLLVGENLAGDSPPHPTDAGAPLHPANSVHAATLRQWTELLPRIRPEATEADVALLVELLADWDFRTGGKPSPQ